MVRLAARPRKAPRRVPVAAGPPDDAAALCRLLMDLGPRAIIRADRWLTDHGHRGVEFIDLDGPTARRLYAEAVQPIHAEAVASAWVDPPF
jgi:hypothetical protein